MSAAPAWRLYLLVGAGGALGGAARWWLGLVLAGTGSLPWATLLANVLGSLLIGIYAALPTDTRWTRGTRHVFVTAGLCGGFTTFSLFSLETVRLLQTDWLLGAGWAAFSLLLWLLAVSLGYRTGKYFSTP